MGMVTGFTGFAGFAAESLGRETEIKYLVSSVTLSKHIYLVFVTEMVCVALLFIYVHFNLCVRVCARAHVRERARQKQRERERL